ncbi:WDR75 [Bugula neritina]|uniref:WDR75 n=1 Tax=Bugula neritina TaxID=10212 RepID=A0A7J7KTC0_BUGNE|nr:WDR75 [Bugula neritina]
MVPTATRLSGSISLDWEPPSHISTLLKITRSTSLRHLDNSIKVVRNWIVVQIFQGLTRDHLSAGKDAFVAGVNFEPRSGALVLNGLPGHLQFYSLNEDTLLYNLDIVGQNYTSGDSLAHQHNYTRIELVDFTADGSWMVTVERWSGSYSEQCRMKLWFYDTETSSYVLNTDIDRPHQGGVASVRFSICASEDDSQTIMLVSVGSADRKFKLWRITDSQSDGRKSGSSWRMESTGYYKNKNCLSAEFSDDGSILAVIFANSLTLWDPFENQLCTAFDLKSDIKSAKFCHGAQANYIAIATENDVILWDLLAYSEKYKWEGVSCKFLVVDPLSDFFLGFSANAGYIFSCSGDMKSIDFPSYARNITTAAFTTNKQATTAPHSVKRRVYLSSSTGSLLVVDDKDVADRPDVTPTVEEASKNRLAKNYQQLTPLANLLAGNLVQQNRDSKAQIDSRRGLAATQLVQQIGETSCVAMPSINTLCRAFIHSLLIDTLPKSKRKQDEDSESEMEVESSDSENEESVPRKPLVDDVSNAPQETAGRRLRKSDVLDFRNAGKKSNK